MPGPNPIQRSRRSIEAYCERVSETVNKKLLSTKTTLDARRTRAITLCRSIATGHEDINKAARDWAKVMREWQDKTEETIEATLKEINELVEEGRLELEKLEAISPHAPSSGEWDEWNARKSDLKAQVEELAEQSPEKCVKDYQRAVRIEDKMMAYAFELYAPAVMTNARVKKQLETAIDGVIPERGELKHSLQESIDLLKIPEQAFRQFPRPKYEMEIRTRFFDSGQYIHSMPFHMWEEAGIGYLEPHYLAYQADADISNEILPPQHRFQQLALQEQAERQTGFVSDTFHLAEVMLESVPRPRIEGMTEADAEMWLKEQRGGDETRTESQSI